jgi:hypothetical protein
VSDRRKLRAWLKGVDGDAEQYRGQLRGKQLPSAFLTHFLGLRTILPGQMGPKHKISRMRTPFATSCSEVKTRFANMVQRATVVLPAFYS